MPGSAYPPAPTGRPVSAAETPRGAIDMETKLRARLLEIGARMRVRGGGGPPRYSLPADTPPSTI